MMDFGYPQYTEAKILSEFIKTDAYRMEVTQRPPMAVTNAVSWRSEGIVYKKNEVCQASFLFFPCYFELNFLSDETPEFISKRAKKEEKKLSFYYHVVSGIPGCGRKCKYTGEQQWPDSSFRSDWGSENENLFEVLGLTLFPVDELYFSLHMVLYALQCRVSWLRKLLI